MLVNYMEILVEEAINDLIIKHPSLKTELNKQDIIDIKIFSLNRLSPSYTTREKGYVFTKAKMMDIQSKINIVSIVALGVEEMISRKKQKFEFWEFPKLDQIKK